MKAPWIHSACLAIALLLAGVSPGMAHPIPDVPVRADFAQDGSWTLQVEVDPRCFEDDPNVALSVTRADLALFPAEKQEKLKTQAAEYVKKVVEIVLDPPVPVNPAFEFEFTTHENAPLEMPEDVVVMTGTWKTKVPEGTTGYSIKALPAGTLSVIYHNTALGKKLDRMQILFPGEESFVLDLKTYTPRTPAPPVIMADGSGDAICADCYGANTQQTLPVVVGAVALVMVILWWKGRRPRRPVP